MRYICGDSFRDKAGLVLDYVYRGIDGKLDLPQELEGKFEHNDIILYEREDNGIFFAATHLVRRPGLDFPKDKLLITHNSDEAVNFPLVESKKWFSQNGNFEGVIPVPIGIENQRFSKWPLFDELRANPVQKTIVHYLNVHPGSNPVERNKCIQVAKNFGIENDFYLDTSTTANYFTTQTKYLKKLQSSCFVLSPNGNGIDCHRTWEALYMGAIPIVTKSYVTTQLAKYFPLYIIDDWTEFKPFWLTENLYYDVWKNFDQRYLDFDFFWDIINK
jgi:hypothetical protein